MLSMLHSSFHCPTCGAACVVPSLAAEHCEPIGRDGQGAPIYRHQTEEN